MSCVLGMPGLHNLFQSRLLDFATVHDDYISINLHTSDKEMISALKRHLASLHCTSPKSSSASSFKFWRKV